MLPISQSKPRQLHAKSLSSNEFRRRHSLCLRNRWRARTVKVSPGLVDRSPWVSGRGREGSGGSREHALKRSGARWARWGSLATTFALGAGLLLASWASYRRASQASSTLTRGQSEVLIEASRQFLRPLESAPDSAALAAFLEQQSTGGLRYVALLNAENEVVAFAGEPLDPAAEIPSPAAFGPPAPLAVGSVVRLTFPIPPAGVGRRGDGRPDQRVRFERSRLLLEFEPVVARELEARAGRALALAGLATAALLMATLVFWRMSIRSEQFERRLEHERRLGLIGEMSAVLAHEIRNPLASLKGSAQLLAERLPEEGPDRRKADRIVHEAKRLETLIGELLDFARTGPIQRVATDPARLLRDCAGDVDAGEVAVDVSAAPASWMLDAPRVRQALTNLLRNALQASPADRPAEASVAEVSGRLVFTVRDHGPGIQPGDEERIFAPFYTTRTAGTGLGLAVARRVAEMHDGTITASNAPGGGAVFRMMIPKSA